MVRALAALFAILLTSTAALAQQAQPRRPALLVPMYLSNIALNGADMHSTLMALKVGHVEANPLLRSLTPPQMIAAKAAFTAAAIVMTERMWKRHRVAAVTVMVIGNSALAVIAARNYRLARE